MARDWKPLPISGELFENVDETQITESMAAMENCFVSESGGHSKFPGLTAFSDLKTVGS